jgi:hypothetical protein
MKAVDIDFAQRIHLVNLLSMQEGTIGRLAPFMRILDQVRFTDEEDKQIVRTPADNNLVTFTPPNPAFGKIQARIENGDAAVLAELIGSWPHFKASDGAWVIRLQQSLRFDDFSPDVKAL